jgi:hypothetical protein
MTRLVLSSWFVLLSLATCLFAQPPDGSEKTSETESPSLLILIDDPGHSSTLSKVASYIAQQYGLRTRVEDIRSERAAGTPNAVAAAKRLLRESDIGAILYYSGESTPIADVLAFQSSRVGIVSCSALKPVAGDEGDSSQKLDRRMEMEGMQWTAVLLGLESCPWPRCVMYGVDDPRLIDTLGRNLCPPCQQKAAEARVRALRMRSASGKGHDPKCKK